MSDSISAMSGARLQSAQQAIQQAERTMDFLENNNLRAVDADTFEQLKDLADKIEVDPDSKIKGPLKTVLTAVALAGASAVTASALSGRMMNYLSKNTQLMEKAGNLATKMMDAAQKFVKKNPNLKSKNIKGKALRVMQKALKNVEKYSKAGIEEALKGIKGRGSKAKKAALQGKNLVEKIVKGTAVTVFGGKTLHETTVDKDKNGIADFSEKGGKKKDAKVAEALTEALIASAA